MNTYLVTGGAGFIGSNFIQYMLKYYKDLKIINLDNLTYAGNLDNLHSVEHLSEYVFVRGNIMDSTVVEQIFAEYEVDCVINFAAESHVDRSIEDPEIFVKTNVLGTANLLNIAKKHWQRGEDRYRDGCKFLQVSTDEVYGSLGTTGFFTEETPLDPHSPYSASKAAADLLVKSYYDTYRMPINITRCSNNYGPYQFTEKLIPLIISKALKHENIPVYGDGLNVRDWLFVEDHCHAIDLVLRRGKIGEVYNIGGHNEKTNIEIVKLILSKLKEKADKTIGEELVQYVEDRKGHDRRYAIDSLKISTTLDWEPKTDFVHGIDETIDWFINNLKYVRTTQED